MLFGSFFMIDFEGVWRFREIHVIFVPSLISRVAKQLSLDQKLVNGTSISVFLLVSGEGAG